MILSAHQPLTLFRGIFMKSVKLSVVAAVFAVNVSILPVTLFAGADLNCSFNSQLDAGSYRYNVAATSDNSCKSQLLRISVYRDGTPFTQFTTPAESIVEKAWIVDLDDDSKPELIVVSHDPADESKKSMGLYTVDGSILKQVRFPAPPDMSGYRGGDTFQRDGVRMVRVFPVYRPRDISGIPTGGERRVVYQYRNRELLIGSALEDAIPAASVKTVTKKAAGKTTKGSVLKVNGIKPKSDYIEIEADGSIENYKVIRIDEPWRLIIDIAGAGSGIKAKTVVINRHGVSTARIGEHKGYLRIVFDFTVSPMPTETITPAENALRIGFYGNTAK